MSKSYSSPRHGSKGFMPKHRVKKLRQSIRAFPKDDQTMACHFTGFYGYKVGMTHIIRVSEKRSSDKRAKENVKKEIVDAVTLVEVPPMVVMGIVGYKKTENGLKNLATLVAEHIGESVRRRSYRRYFDSKKRAYSNMHKKYSDDGEIAKLIGKLKEADSIRAIVHTQTDKVTSLGMKKAHIAEVQVNGGTIDEKIQFVRNLFEREVPISRVFSENERIDATAVTKGKGFQGVIARYGVTRKTHKSNKGCRKVGSIGGWTPGNVVWTVPREGQLGKFRRTVFNKQIYKMGDADVNISTEYDLTEKFINPMGGFNNYGNISSQYLMVKGSLPGPPKMVMALRKPIASQKQSEKCMIKFVDTSSKNGKGKFQTSGEKKKYLGMMKKNMIEERIN